MRLLKSMVLAIGLLMCMNFCWAASSAPVAMLEGVTSQVMDELRANRDSLQNNPSQLYQLVNRFILPHADFAEMGRWVVGRNAWQNASVAAQEEFINEFKTLVVRSYAGALLGYTDQRIEFLPVRDANKTRVQVSSLVKDGIEKPLHLDYRLLKVGDEWKVYDIIIEGVSLMGGYRAQFSNEAKTGGLQAVTDKIRQHNKARGSKRGTQDE
jgi:phospholipid transport system substrate-binding protein